MSRIAAAAALWVLSLAGLGQPIAALQTQPARPAPPPGGNSADLQVLPVRGGIYMLAGAGSNITLQVGEDGVLMVDTGSGLKSDQVVAAIRKLTDKPLRWIINTHVHADHTGGNAAVAKAGRSVPQLRIGTGKLYEGAEETATLVSHNNVVTRMSAPPGGGAPVPSENWPTATFVEEEKELFFNGEPIQILHQPAAHTDGDVFVFFRRTDVVAAGDVFVTTGYPVIDVPAGGTVNGFITAINSLIHITIPQEKQEGGTYVIPGHGRLSDEADVVEFRDMATIIRDRIQNAISKGMTLEQVKAARLTRDYDDRYGATSGPWTTEKFVEAVYRTLPRPAAKARP